MSEAKHTPGPWLVGGPYPGTSVCIEVDSGCGGPYPEPPVWEPICILDQRTEGEPNPQAVANANLIAAAPELLEALHNLLDGIERTSCTCHQAYTGRGLRDPDCQRCHLDIGPDELDAARAAIAKATGAAP